MRNNKLILIVILVIALIGFSQIGRSQGAFHVYLTESYQYVREQVKKIPVSDIALKLLRRLIPSED